MLCTIPERQKAQTNQPLGKDKHKQPWSISTVLQHKYQLEISGIQENKIKEMQYKYLIRIAHL